MTPQREANNLAHNNGYSQPRKGTPILRLSCRRHNMIQRRVADLCSLYLCVSHSGCWSSVLHSGVASCPANQVSAVRGCQVFEVANLSPKKSSVTAREFPFAISQNSLSLGRPNNSLSIAPVATPVRRSAGCPDRAARRPAPSMPSSPTSSRALIEGRAA
jgi:hypothetical protein